jgi:Spy/CpxP family protein refolding chaperone
MTRNRMLLLVIVCFLAAFAAGLAVGLVATGHPDRPRHRSWLMAELKLTPQQRDQMGKIWSEVMEGSGRQHGEQRKAIAEERDKAIAAILTADQQPKYKQIQEDYTGKLADLSQQRKAAFEQAVERTKQILTPEQAKQYEELLKKQRDRGFGGPRGMGPGPRPGRGGSASRPTSTTSQSVGHPTSHGEK